MSAPVIQSTGSTHITASTAVGALRPGRLMGIFVASASTVPTIAVYDGADATGKVLANTFTPAGATWYTIPAQFNNGLFVAISGTVDCTVFWEP